MRYGSLAFRMRHDRQESFDHLVEDRASIAILSAFRFLCHIRQIRARRSDEMDAFDEGDSILAVHQAASFEI